MKLERRVVGSVIGTANYCSAAGFVGTDGQAFVAQDHPQGRVTFIDPATGLVRTITGFELGASVVVWSRDGGQ